MRVAPAATGGAWGWAISLGLGPVMLITAGSRAWRDGLVSRSAAAGMILCGAAALYTYLRLIAWAVGVG